MTSLSLPQSTRLSFSGTTAELQRDTLTDDGVVLFIDGAEQSHVETTDPSWLLHDYIRRMSHILSSALPKSGHVEPGRSPLTALHLGAGALTLPRWVEAHPGWEQATQTVVDIEPELVDFVLTHLPMRGQPENIVDDAAHALDSTLAGRMFDVVVLDLFNSAAAPDHITSETFYTQAFQAVTDHGLLLMNLGDEADMTFARAQVNRLLAITAAERSLLTAPDAVVAGAEEGNLVFAASPAGFTDAQLNQIWAAGPHPCELLTGDDLTHWAQPST